MASTSPAVTLPQTLGFTLGQGNYPVARYRISYDNVDVANPTWTEVANIDQRGFSTSRGREGEHSEFDAGTASVELDNRDRAFDPLFNSAVRPFNRVWITCELFGIVKDIFKGYVSAWEQAWPGGGWSDAVATANAADEFTVLSQAALPATSPPRDTYAGLVGADNPTDYWELSDDPSTRQHLAVEAIGPTEPPESPGSREVPGQLKRTDRRNANLRTSMLRKR